MTIAPCPHRSGQENHPQQADRYVSIRITISICGRPAGMRAEGATILTRRKQALLRKGVGDAAHAKPGSIGQGAEEPSLWRWLTNAFSPMARGPGAYRLQGSNHADTILILLRRRKCSSSGCVQPRASRCARSGREGKREPLRQHQAP